MCWLRSSGSDGDDDGDADKPSSVKRVHFGRRVSAKLREAIPEAEYEVRYAVCVCTAGKHIDAVSFN